MNRRAFLKSTVAGVSLATGAGALSRFAMAAEGGKQGVPLRLSCQISKVPGKGFAEKIKRLEEWGAQGVELHGNPKNALAEMTKVFADSPIKVSALCWGSCSGKLVSPDTKLRQEGADAIKSALETAGKLGANGVIFVPCFHKQSDLKPEELDKVVAEVLPPLGEFAAQCKTCVILEPLRKGETFYLNRLDHAVRICKQIDNPGIAMMGDFYHMTREEQDEKQAFVQAGALLKHVHIASRKTRKLPGTDDDSYVDGFRGLKQIAYPQYVSFECGIKKGQKAEEGIPTAFRMLEKQWADATV